MKIKKICKQCEKEFEIYPYREKTANYCSQVCEFRARQRRIIKICFVCKKKFEIKLSDKNRKFCSRKCMGLFFNKRIKKYCLTCGKEYLPQFSHRFQSKYCSKKCFGLAEKGKKRIRSGKYKICPICKKSFYCRPKEFARRTCCSNRCKYQYKSLNNWKKDEHLFNYFAGRFNLILLGRNKKPIILPKFQLTDLDKKAIKAKILIHKIRRSLNVNK